jgi:hypothetical protein
MFTAEGIIIENVPEAAFAADQHALYEIPMDLGVVIKSTKLLDFKPILTKELAKQGIEVHDD